MRPAIRVESLSKRFRLGTRQFGGYRTIRESLTDAVRAPFKRLGSRLGGGRREAAGGRSDRNCSSGDSEAGGLSSRHPPAATCPYFTISTARVRRFK